MAGSEAKSLSAAGPAPAVSPEAAGVVLVDKPAGMTSFRIVQLVRRALGIKKVGHAGTLDPFATGLLVVCVGRPATRLIDGLMGGDKEYEAELRLGIETETLDPEGAVVAERPVPVLADREVDVCLAAFRGEQLQRPPRYSAVKHRGKPLYYYARKGIEVVKEPRRIVVRELELLGRTADTLRLRLRCSKGTYVRTLAADIGRALGCGAHLRTLRRLASGGFSVAGALDGAMLADAERSLAAALLRQRLLPVAAVREQLAAEAGEE